MKGRSRLLPSESAKFLQGRALQSKTQMVNEVPFGFIRESISPRGQYRASYEANFGVAGGLRGRNASENLTLYLSEEQITVRYMHE